MPITPTYPGVYVQEIPSGVRTITGVATSIAAFVGRTQRGPVDEPVTINSYGDFERTFGGLWLKSPLSFAVHDFYMNGGNQAIIVRLFSADKKAAAAKAEKSTGSAVSKAVKATAAETAPLTRAKLTINGLVLEAANPGSWGNDLRVRIDDDVSESAATALGVAKGELFNLTVRDTKSGATEQFRNVTVTDNARQLDKVLKNQSSLVVAKNLPATRPAAQEAPAAGKDIFEANAANTASTGVDDADKAFDGFALEVENFTGGGKEAAKEGLYALEHADLFNLLCIPPHSTEKDIEPNLLTAASAYAKKRRAFMIVDPPAGWTDKANAKEGIATLDASKNAAVYFPRLKKPNPLRGNQIEDFAPCGAVAGVMARTDSERGVWKAPAGLEATLNGVPQLSVALTDAENGELNPLGINCLRSIPAAGRVIWGARTMQGNDRLASEWKYVSVRRLALHIEESLYRGTQWVVFEPNDEPLWAQIRLNLGTFMHDLFRKGAFQGTSPKEAYFVKCDHETTTQSDINLGVVNILVGFAPLKPAEFVIISLQQMAGQLQA